MSSFTCNVDLATDTTDRHCVMSDGHFVCLRWLKRSTSHQHRHLLKRKCLLLLKELHQLHRTTLFHSKSNYIAEHDISLLEIEQEEKDGYYPLFHGATFAELEIFQTRFLECFGFPPPIEYIDLLSILDGVDFGLLTLYGAGSECSEAPGVVEQNVNNAHFYYKGLIIFGVFDGNLMLWNRKASTYQLMKVKSGDAMGCFACFWEILAFLLSRTLKRHRRYDDLDDHAPAQVTASGKRKRKTALK